jgi:hypothetical protein
MVEVREGYPPENAHCGFVVPPEPEAITLSDIQHHFEHTQSEIIVVVEAIDPQLSWTFQSLQSYTYEDIMFGEDFEKCMSTRLGHRDGTPTSTSSVVCVNMDQFHATTKRNHSSSSKSVFSESRDEYNGDDSLAERNSRDGTEQLSQPKITTIITFAGHMTPFVLVPFAATGAAGVVVRIPVALGGRRKARRREMPS